jgi:hypothetical protein
MNRSYRCAKILAAFALFVLTADLATAQATRTWVSGVGDDVNPCSRTAPCKTFAGAISKTATGGEINVLDPGGFGAVTITKSISIVNDGVGSAGVVVSGTNAIIVNAPATSVIVLRGLDIEGLGTGLNGVRHLGGGSLTIENCTINNFTQKAVDFEPNGPSQLSIKHTVIRNNVNGAASGGVLIKPGVGQFALASLDGVQIERNTFGVRAENNSRVSIRNSSIAGSTSEGVFSFSSAAGQPTLVTVANTSVINNGTGLRADGSAAAIRASWTTITGNTTGVLSVASGALISSVSNQLGGNTTTDGAFTQNAPLL